MDSVSDGNALAQTRKGRTKRVKLGWRRKPPYKFKSKTPRYRLDAMDWMIEGPIPIENKRATKRRM